MGILLICENCNWEIIPMLLGAWLLGMLFWVAFFRNKNRKRVSALTTDLGKANLQLEKNKRDIEATKYKNQKLTDEVTSLNKQLRSLEIQIERLSKE